MYPSICGGVGNLLRRLVRNGGLTNSKNPKEHIDAKTVIEQIHQEFFTSNCKYLILSDEALSNFSIDEWRTLGQLFDWDSIDVELAFTIREPYSFTLSVIQQCLKSGDKNLDALYSNPPLYSIDRVTDRSAFAFGSTKKSLIPFESLCSSNLTFTDEFLLMTGIHLSSTVKLKDYKNERAKNTSMSQQAAWILDAIRQKEIPSDIEVSMWKNKSQGLCRKINGDKFTVPRACAERIRLYSKNEANTFNKILGDNFYELNKYESKIGLHCEDIRLDKALRDSIADIFYDQIASDIYYSVSHS